MKNLIFCAFSYLPNTYATADVVSKNKNTINKYLDCCYVALVSAKLRNFEDDIALVCNIQLPEKYILMFKTQNIKIIFKEYDNFQFSKDMKWSLAFYKLCALEYVVKNYIYANYVLVDTDTYFISEFNELWEETKSSILLLDLNHSFLNRQNKQMRIEYYKLYSNYVNFTNYGGEFIAGNRQNLEIFIRTLNEIYSDIINAGLITEHGDEYIISIAAHKNKLFIKNASPYVSRQWTGSFYLTSTNYYYNPVNVLHLPREKNYGFYYVIKYMELFGVLPRNDFVYILFGLPTRKKSIIVNVLNFFFKKFD